MDRKIYILQKFISQTLSEEEKTEFQEYMRNDEDFRRKMIRAVEIDNSLDEWLKIGRDSDKQAETLTLFKKPVFYKTALALAAAIAIGLILLSLFQPVNYNKLYKSEYKVLVLEEFRGLSQGNYNNEIIENYQEGNFAAIYAFITNPQNQIKSDDLATLLSGIACIESGDHILAEKQLKRIPADSNYRPTAAWYLALLNLKQNNIETSLQYLNEAEESIIYLDKAQQLKTRISRNRK